MHLFVNVELDIIIFLYLFISYVIISMCTTKVLLLLYYNLSYNAELYITKRSMPSMALQRS
jgi:hypothetical protein